MFDRYRQARDEAGELNLIPIMNLMVTLIPFLMLGAAFYHIGVIPATVPTKVERLDEPPSDAIITLNLELDADALTVTASSATVEPETLASLGFSLPRLADGYDIDSLGGQLLAIKQRYPKSDTVVVLPDDAVRYDELVAVLDAAREKVEVVPDGDPLITPLFPVTVFSKRPPPEPDAGLEEVPPEAPESAP